MKFCKDCSHSRETGLTYFCMVNHREEITLDPVRGEVRSKPKIEICTAMRSQYSQQCGPEALLYEPKLSRKIIAFFKKEAP